MARILLGVTGGIAAYKALEFARLAIKQGHSVRVIETPAATRFVGEVSFACITGAPVLVRDSDADPLRGVFPGESQPTHLPLSHLAVVDHSDLVVIAPASANTIAKLANGLADNLLTAAVLAARCPVVVAPAMNDAMLNNPATQTNLITLRERSITVLDPGVGSLGSLGEWGAGRLIEPDALLKECELLLASSATLHTHRDNGGGRESPYSGLRVLITAGGTREPIDSVRFIGNRSSGRMGLALAEAAKRAGAEVTVIGANLRRQPSDGTRCIAVETAAELQAVCETEFAQTDVLLMAAAVSDWTTAKNEHKLSKREAGSSLTLELKPTPDIVTELAQSRQPGQVIVAFAAEHGADKLVAKARAKLTEKQLDAIIVNDISRPDIGFDAANNEVTIISAKNELKIPKSPKSEIANEILKFTAEHLLPTTRNNPPYTDQNGQCVRPIPKRHSPAS